jgi:pyruvate dehydrogenase (quinone)
VTSLTAAESGGDHAVVAADEMPNLPHLEFEKLGHLALAKIKEAVIATTGR